MRDSARRPHVGPSEATRSRAAGETGPAGGATTRRARGERGFALLVSLIAIVGLTALATGGFFLADSEHKTSSNHHASVEAFHLAEAGLNQYLGNTSEPPAAGYQDTYEYPDAEGEADVYAEHVGETSDGQAIYRVRSVGQYRPDGSGGAAATRAVGTITVVNANALPDPEASYAAGGGITKNGSSGEISGMNPDSCGGGAVAGVRVPEDPGYSQSGGDESDVLEGEPPADSVANPFDFIDNGEEWWQGMKDGTTVPHDYTLKSDDSSSQWPDFSSIDGMPTTYVDKNSIELGDNEDGQGLLIIRGDVTFKGNFDWDGVILIGGSVTDNGKGQIEGAMMTGLNVLTGTDPSEIGQDDIEDLDELNGQKRYLFNSCIVQQVQGATATLAGVPFTWHEEI